MKDKKVVVIGAGISGLVVAYWLHKQGLDTTIIEKNDKVGGVIRSERYNGYLIEHGPTSMIDDSPKVGELLESLGISDQRCEANEISNKRYILKNGSLLALPTSPPAFIKTKLLSTKAKLRLFAEPFIKPVADEKEESVADFISRRLGKEPLDYGVNPFIAGVYAGDPAKLSIRSAFPKIYALEKEYGSLIKGALKGRKKKRSSPGGRLTGKTFCFKDGMGTLPDALGNALGDCLILRSEVQAISELGDGTGPRFQVTFQSDGKTTQIDADAVVLTSPAYKTSDIISNLDSDTARKLKEVVYVPIAVVFMGFKGLQAEQPLDGFGFLVPEVEKRKVLGTIFNSTLFTGRAEDGSATLTTFVGGARQPELLEKNDEHLAEMVLDELKTILGLRSRPDVVRVIHWRHSIPQYSLGFKTIQETIEVFEKTHPGIYLTANFRGGISVSNCILNASETAAALCNYL